MLTIDYQFDKTLSCVFFHHIPSSYAHTKFLLTRMNVILKSTLNAQIPPLNIRQLSCIQHKNRRGYS